MLLVYASVSILEAEVWQLAAKFSLLVLSALNKLVNVREWLDIADVQGELRQLISEELHKSLVLLRLERLSKLLVLLCISLLLLLVFHLLIFILVLFLIFLFLARLLVDFLCENSLDDLDDS